MCGSYSILKVRFFGSCKYKFKIKYKQLQIVCRLGLPRGRADSAPWEFHSLSIFGLQLILAGLHQQAVQSLLAKYKHMSSSVRPKSFTPHKNYEQKVTPGSEDEELRRVLLLTQKILFYKVIDKLNLINRSGFHFQCGNGHREKGKSLTH